MVRPNYKITKTHIENFILCSFIFQNMSHELDKIEFECYKLPYEEFTGSTTNRLVAKAIYNLTIAKEPIDDVMILHYLESHNAKFNPNEFLEITSCGNGSFDTAISYLEKLKKMNIENKKMNVLAGI